MVKRTTVAQRLFDKWVAEDELETTLDGIGVKYDRLGWDDYDCSLEIYGVDKDYRFSDDAQIELQKLGFDRIYVNHVDKWETHYNYYYEKRLTPPVKPWRVSYPHKRGEKETEIWLEEKAEWFPQEWYDTGYAVVKEKNEM